MLLRLGLTALALPQIALFLAEIILGTTVKVGGALFVLALLDYGFQRWKHEQDLKMTKVIGRYNGMRH